LHILGVNTNVISKPKDRPFSHRADTTIPKLSTSKQTFGLPISFDNFAVTRHQSNKKQAYKEPIKLY
jgi:hypothetical protein